MPRKGPRIVYDRLAVYKSRIAMAADTMMRGFPPVISADKLLQQIGRPDWRVIDCRFDLMAPEAGRKSWLAGHIPGAVHADLDNDLAGPITDTSGRHPLPNPQDFAELLGSWGVDNESTVVVYDAAGGAIAARSWWMLKWVGHERVALLDGGYPAWQRAGGKIESGAVQIDRRHFVTNLRPNRVITTEEVIAQLPDTANFRLLDARAAARYRGEMEPIDSVAGHVAAAVNLPFGRILNADGNFKSAGDLRDLFNEALGEAADGAWAVMCGSGVTACHLAVAADLAGLSAPRLYVGSWSEWIRDPERPVESLARH